MTATAQALRRALAALMVGAVFLAAAGHAAPWRPGQEVRIATAPNLRLFSAGEDAAPALARGYAALVARHSGLDLIELPLASIQAGMDAVCNGEADLVWVQDAGSIPPLPCPGLVASRSTRGGRSAVAQRATDPRAQQVAGLDAVVLAVVEGGPYPIWLSEHHPAARVLPMPSLHEALMAVETGVADAALGLESNLRPLARRHFPGALRLHALDQPLPAQRRLLAKAENQDLLDHIEGLLHAISIDEHAVVLRHWQRQASPAGAQAPTIPPWTRHASWLLPAGALLLVAPFVAWRLHGSGRRRERAQARAVGMISHEVRNSAQVVMTSIDLLRQSSLPAGPRELVAAAAHAGQSLRSLLNRAIDFSRLASGAFQPRPRPCDIRQLCEQALAAVAPQAAGKALDLQLTLSPDPLPQLALDPDCLRQLLDNLLGNAIKFTDSGSIEVRVQLEMPARPASLLLQVIDSGVGIPPEQLAGLFQPFQQGEEGKGRGGSGLGLSICRQLARAMGGELDVHSVHGRGSRFILRVPVELPADSAPAAQGRPNLHPLAGIDLLLVEDHDLNRHMLAQQLRRLGARVRAVGTGAAALTVQAATPRAVVLLDIGLPDMSGYALAARLRRLHGDGRPRPTLLALSARSGRAHALRCRLAGMDGALAKPLQAEQLLLRLGRTGCPQATHSPANPQTEMAADYAAAIDAELSQLRSALDARDARALAHHAHRLLGVLQMSGATDMQPVAHDLHALADARGPDWATARRLLQVVQAWRDSRAAEAAPAV